MWCLRYIHIHCFLLFPSSVVLSIIPRSEEVCLLSYFAFTTLLTVPSAHHSLYWYRTQSIRLWVFNLTALVNTRLGKSTTRLFLSLSILHFASTVPILPFVSMIYLSVYPSQLWWPFPSSRLLQTNSLLPAYSCFSMHTPHFGCIYPPRHLCIGPWITVFIHPLLLMSSVTIHLHLGHILIPLGITPLCLQVLDPLFLHLSHMDVRDLFCIVLMIMFLVYAIWLFSFSSYLSCRYHPSSARWWASRLCTLRIHGFSLLTNVDVPSTAFQ